MRTLCPTYIWSDKSVCLSVCLCLSKPRGVFRRQKRGSKNKSGRSVSWKNFKCVALEISPSPFLPQDFAFNLSNRKEKVPLWKFLLTAAPWAMCFAAGDCPLSWDDALVKIQTSAYFWPQMSAIKITNHKCNVITNQHEVQENRFQTVFLQRGSGSPKAAWVDVPANSFFSFFGIMLYADRTSSRLK